MSEPRLAATVHVNGQAEIRVQGSWTLKTLADRKRLKTMEQEVSRLASRYREAPWNLEAATLDHFGALVLRETWIQAQPVSLI